MSLLLLIRALLSGDLYNPLMKTEWKNIKSVPALQKGEVHVWRVFLDWAQAELQQALQILSAEEKQHAQRLVFDEHRSRFTASHAALRHILSHYINKPLTEFHYIKGSHGKPYLVDEPILQFNMSDSKQLALYAITTHREVGVDIEWMRPGIDVEGIAKRFFSVEEQQQLLALPSNQQFAAFYRCWSRKEAYIKVIGQGLSFPLGQFSVSLQPEGMHNLLTVHNSTEQAKQWSLGSITAAEDYAAALAVEGEITQIHYFDWQL